MIGPAIESDVAGRFRQTLVTDADEDLARLVRETSRAGDEVTSVVAVGELKRALMALASACADDRIVLIVRGASGQRAVDRAVLGFTAHVLVRQADSLPLTVRAIVRR